MKVTYVSVGKPLLFQKFELYNAPFGWNRIDLLKNRLKTDKEYRAKFTKKELEKIKAVDK